VVGKGWVDKMNLAARRGGTSGVRRALGFANGGIYPGGHQAFADGGVLDWINSKAASAFDWLKNTSSATYKALSNPIQAIKDSIASKVSSIPGVGKVKEYGIAAKDKLVGMAANKIKSMFTSFKDAMGQSKFVKAGEWAWDKAKGVVRAITGGSSYGKGVGHALSRVRAALLPGLSITSTYRSPSRNRAVGGHPQSLHMNAANPAVDIGGPTYLLDRFYAVLKRMGGWRQLKWRVAGHYDHIHAAKMGGIVPPIAKAPIFDSGGTLRPGLNLVRNNTGANEPLVPVDRTGGNTYITVEVKVDDLRELSDVAEFLELLKSARVTKRKTERSGKVSA